MHTDAQVPVNPRKSDERWSYFWLQTDWNSVTTSKRVFWPLALSVYLKLLHTHLQYLPGGEKAVRKITSSGPESRQYITMWKVRSDWNGREWCKRSKIDIGARSSGSRWGHLSIFMASVGFFFEHIRRLNKVTWLPARISLCSISFQLEIAHS